MFFGNIPYFRLNEEVNKKVIGTLLDYCDVAQYVNRPENGMRSIENLRGTKFADFADSFISSSRVDIYDGKRKAFRFLLSDEIKALIVENGLGSVVDNKKTLLEDLSLYRDGTLIYSSVSHEGIEELSENEATAILLKELKKVAVAEMKKQPIYKEMSDIAASLRGTSPKILYREWHIVFDLHCYVDEAKHVWIYQCPEFSCDFPTYKAIAIRYLTPQTFSELKYAKDFADLHPMKAPKTVKDVMAKRHSNYQQFLSTDYCRRVHTELLILKEILGIKENF